MLLTSCGRSLDLSTPKIMGILNVTPDSFSDGGRYNQVEKAYAHAVKLVEEGADIIDIGGESTRPEAKEVSEDEELQRVIPVVERLAGSLDVMLSLDTSKAAVMKAGIAAGAHLINDIRALRAKDALSTCLELNCAVILMHMQGEPKTMQIHPHYQNVTLEVKSFLLTLIQQYLKAGLRDEQILLDPGFGFGKSVADNYRLLAGLPELGRLGYPLVTGLSRKSMIGAVCHESNPLERICGSVAGALLCVQKGAKIVRVHDVGATRQALAVLQALQQAEQG